MLRIGPTQLTPKTSGESNISLVKAPSEKGPAKPKVLILDLRDFLRAWEHCVDTPLLWAQANLSFRVAAQLAEHEVEISLAELAPLGALHHQKCSLRALEFHPPKSVTQVYIPEVLP